MSLIHILNNYHDPFPHLKGRGGLQFHPSRHIIGGALKNELAIKEVKDMLTQMESLPIPEHIDTTDVEQSMKTVEDTQLQPVSEPEKKYLNDTEIKEIKLSQYKNKSQLTSLCESMKLPTDGTNKDMIDRIKKRMEQANEKPKSKTTTTLEKHSKIISNINSEKFQRNVKMWKDKIEEIDELTPIISQLNDLSIEAILSNKVDLVGPYNDYIGYLKEVEDKEKRIRQRSNKDEVKIELKLTNEVITKMKKIIKIYDNVRERVEEYNDKVRKELSKITKDVQASIKNIEKSEKQKLKELSKIELQKKQAEKAEEDAKELALSIEQTNKKEKNEKAIKHYEDKLMKKGFSILKSNLEMAQEPKINAYIPDVEYQMKEIQKKEPWKSLTKENIKKVAYVLYKTKIAPYTIMSDVQMKTRGIEYTIDNAMKKQILEARAEQYEMDMKKKLINQNIIQPVFKISMNENQRHGDAYELWLARTEKGNTLMKKITGTTQQLTNSKSNKNIEGGVGGLCVYDFYNDKSELEVKFYNEAMYFNMLKDDTQGFKFQKAKFIGGENSKGSFKPYFIMDNGKLILYNIMQIYDVKPDGSYKQKWINNTTNKQVYFSVCCGDAVVALNMNDLNYELQEVDNPLSGPKKLQIFNHDKINKMIRDGDLLEFKDKENVYIQAKYFKPVEII